MKKLIYLIFIISLNLLILSCNKSKVENNDIAQNEFFIKLNSTIDNNLIDSTFFNPPKVIFLESNDNSLLKKINRIAIDENQIFIFDRSLKKILIFDYDGKYLTNIHNLGEGPSEYISAMDFALDTEKKQIYLLCDRPYKIMKFGYDGKFIDEKKIEDLSCNIAVDNNYIYCNRSDIGNNDPDLNEIDVYDKNLKLVGNCITLRNNINNNIAGQGNVLTTGGSVCYTRRFDNSIYQLKGDSILTKYTIDFAEHNLPSKFLKVETSEDFKRNNSNNDYVYSITDVVDNKNFMSFKTNLGIFIYDKKNNQLNGFKLISNSALKIGSNSYYAVSNKESMIASIIDPIRLDQIKKAAKEIPSFDNFEALKLAQKSNIDDNPVLLLYEFKQR